MDTYRKINIGLVAIFTIVGIGASLYFDPLCTPVNCQNSYTEQIFQMLGITFAAWALLFLLLPRDYFKAWVQYILSWIIPLGIFLAIYPEVIGTLFRVRLVDVVTIMVYLLCFVTGFFILGRFLWLRRKNR